jgi:TetR/AcrR family transcriptional regulator, fatty acid metabolism regulator protein
MSVPGRKAVKTARRARRRTYLRADARRAQILDVAKDVFAEHGYHDSNIADICKAARIGRGTLYQYFDNKREVMIALMEGIEERVSFILNHRQRVAMMEGVNRVPRSVIAAFCKKRLRELLDAVFVDEATLRLVLREARNLDGYVDEVISDIDERVLAALEDDLRAAQAAGVMRQVDLKLSARYIVGGVEKMVLTALADDAPVDLDAIVHAAVELELFGLLKEEIRE